ncbi:MAG: T9SS type A sorting domain-containing protein [Bacteroidetes bacterium]|nr:T9SS type A sorting domain-containing protein [Bacteroidota bacterium]
MQKKALLLSLLVVFVGHSDKLSANKITATPGNYTTYISGLQPGDTLFLTAGNYTNGLTLNNINGTALTPIVIMGTADGYTSVLQGRSCCNTVSITKCSYLVVRDFKIDGLNLAVDAVKAEGTKGNWAHHITLENNYIINHGNNQQIVGISTKCSAWNWIIRGNTIVGAGTGLYLGNSTGEAPFVAGLIENNLVMNTVGYNMEIKHQLDTVRDNFAGTANDNQTTIIRYNVWSKASNASTGANARPVVLLGAFPGTGFGTNDHYEVYGNFFYENPVEALIQVTGNTALYSNIFVNHQDPGTRTVYITSHNGFSPRNINVFHNTVLSNTSTGGIRLYNPNTSFNQYCYANAVLSKATPVSGFTNAVNDVTDTYANAGNYINSASTTLSSLDLYPKSGQLQGTATSSTLFQSFTDWDKDFNRTIYNWTYRGAYSGSGTNPGWHLQMAIMTTGGTVTGINNNSAINDFLGMVYPNPVNNSFDLDLDLEENSNIKILITNPEGQILKMVRAGEMPSGKNKITVNTQELASGFYLLSAQFKDRVITRKFLISK